MPAAVEFLNFETPDGARFRSEAFRPFTAAALVILTVLAALAFFSGAAFAQGDAGLSELEPSDDYRPDGYYEPYDFSFVKTAPAPETPSPTQHPLPPEAYGQQPFTGEQPDFTPPPQNPPPGGYNDPQMSPEAPVNAPPPDLEPIVVPDPPDFNSLTVAPSPGQPNSVVTDFSTVQNPFNETGAAPDTGASAHPQNLNISSAQPVSNPAAGKAAEALKLFVRKGKKPIRYKLTDEAISANIERIVGGKSLLESNWNELHDGLLSLYSGAVSNNLSAAEPLDEEFERINSVLMTYMLSYGAPDFDSVIIKYKTYYFAFLGPLAGVPTNFKPSNPEAKYKLLRLLGGDIIKIISGSTIMFSLKPLSFCVSDIMREVANGEFYKLEVLFRVMTSADAPVRNLVRPFFQLLKSKIMSARDLEKSPEPRANYSKAYELLNKVK